MNTPTPISYPEPAWQSLGELALLADGDQDAAVRRWLQEVLHLLDLPEDFLDRMLQSVAETAARALEALPADGPGQITLIIFSDRDAFPAGKAWGYFSITKTAHPDGRENPAIHWYLYREA